MDIDLTQCQSKLIEINMLLKQKCPELSLILDYSFNLNGNITRYSKGGKMLLLCLYYNNNCISSIEMQFSEYIKNPLAIIINSKTTEEYNNRKYNTLLRSILIYISEFITIKGKNINQIVSHGVNKVTIYTMIKYFNATLNDDLIMNAPFIEYIKEKSFNINLIQQYFKDIDTYNEGIMLFIDLTNKEFMKLNYENINNYINNIICITTGGNRRKYKKKIRIYKLLKNTKNNKKQKILKKLNTRKYKK